MVLTFAPKSVGASRALRDCVPYELFLVPGHFPHSAATLTLQNSIIRLLSVAQWYHFAFMVVSMALLMYGASSLSLSTLYLPQVLSSFQGESILFWQLFSILPSYYRVRVGIPGGFPYRRPFACPEPPGGLEIQLKKGLIYGKV